MVQRIPGFNRYITDRDGVVTNVVTDKTMTCTGPYELYQLIDDTGRRRRVSRKTILEMTFPELYDEPPPITYGRALIPGFPEYEIDRYGDVYRRDTGSKIRVKHQGFMMYYTLHQRGKRYNRTMLSLLREAFPEENH